MRSTTDNTSGHENNWIQRLREQIEPHAQAVVDAMIPVPREDDSGIVDFRVDDTVGFVSDSVRGMANLTGADFDVDYAPSGYVHPVTGEHVIPTYQSGTYRGEPSDQYILRSDTHGVVGNMSGRYPTRDGYKHVLDTLDSMFPNSCESISVYGNGERVVVEQVLDKPFDLGGGDLIQPYIYTRMSLNGTWKTEIIPITRRISCENMLGHSGQLIGVRATKNHDQLLTMKASVVEMSMAQGQALKQMAQTLQDQEFTDFMFMQMLEQLLPVPEPDAHHKTMGAWVSKRAACNASWRDEIANYADSTMWNAYNAMQAAEQHRINTGFKTTEKAQQRSLTKALDGKTPIADAAEQYLMSLVLAEEPF
tara:strand:+ start:1493 stop:2584 length:1092 start_codon:yes stop_codon:yes gene_type:complete